MMILPGPDGLAGCSELQHDSARIAIAEKAVATNGLLNLGMARIDAPNGDPMATATSSPAVNTPHRHLRTARFVLLALLSFATLWLVWNWDSITGRAKLSAAYGAHIACSCRYVEGRDMTSCETDLEPGMEIMSLSDDQDNKRVTAWIPFLAEAVAERRGAFGCVQLNEQEIEAL